MKKILSAIILLFGAVLSPAQELSLSPGLGVVIGVDGVGANVSLAATEYLLAGVQGGTHIRQTEGIYHYPVYGNAFYIAPYLRYTYPSGNQLRPFIQAQFFSFSGTHTEKISPDRSIEHSLTGKEFQLISGAEYFITSKIGVYLQIRFFKSDLDNSSSATQFGLPSLGAEWFF